MPARSHPTVQEDDAEQPGDSPSVIACRSSPGKFVFIESENSDGWIATDHTVECRR